MSPPILKQTAGSEPPSGGGYSIVARDDEQQVMLGGMAEDDSSDAARTSGGPKQHHTYEVTGEAINSIQQVAISEWGDGRAAGAEELQASAADLNGHLVHTMLHIFCPDYTVTAVRPLAGAPRDRRCCRSVSLSTI